MNNGFVMLLRSDDTEELMKHDHNAFILLSYAALHARFKEGGVNPYGCKIGECVLPKAGDLNLTRGQTREATKRLANYGFATSRTTSKGTYIRLTGKVFQMSGEKYNQPNNHLATSQQPAHNQRTTSQQPLTKKGNNVIEGKEWLEGGGEEFKPRSEFPDGLAGDSAFTTAAAKLYFPRLNVIGIESALKDSGCNDQERKEAVEAFVNELHCIGDAEKSFPLRLLRGYLRKASTADTASAKKKKKSPWELKQVMEAKTQQMENLYHEMGFMSDSNRGRYPDKWKEYLAIKADIADMRKELVEA